MGFLNPLAFALAALAAPIVALYFLKLRREERTISSTYLWRTLVRDTAANAPWQRLQPNLLLLLQLLFLLVLVLALIRPYVWNKAVTGDHLVLVLDTSASMGATDESPDRMAAAIREARQMVQALPSDARVTLITAGASTAVAVSGATDRNLVYRALEGVTASAGGSDLSAALELASAIAAREGDPETMIFSDGNVTLPGSGTLSIPGRVRYVPVGRGAADGKTTAGNQSIMALSLRTSAGGQGLSAFAQVANFGPDMVERRLSLYSGGQPIAARTLSLAPGHPQALTFEDLPAETGVVEARLEGGDALAIDDRAWAAPVAREMLRIDLVGPGNRFLETALSLLPGLQVTTVKSEDYGATRSSGTQTAAVAREPAGLTIFDGVAPPEQLPAGALLFLAPVGATDLFSVTGKIEQPAAAAARADEPLLRYTDLRGLQIQEAGAVPLPAWARAVIVAEGPGQQCGGAQACPLLFAGETGGRRVAVLAFDVRKSDLPLRVAFPLLLANLIDYLNAGAGAGSLPEQVQPGQPVTLLAPPEATRLIVTLPDGSTRQIDVSAGAGPGGVIFGETGQVGPYQVAWAGEGKAGGRLGTFAANLYDPRESAIQTRNTLAVQGSADAGGADATRQSRQEWWRPLAWLALALLAIEWLYAHRGQVARLYALLPEKLKP